MHKQTLVLFFLAGSRCAWVSVISDQGVHPREVILWKDDLCWDT